MSHWYKQGVLVTGGAGFIGSHLVERLNAAGARVTVLDHHATPEHPNLAPIHQHVTMIPMTVEAALETLDIGRFDTIFHLGGNPYVPPSVDDPVMDYEKNLHTTFKLLERLRAHPTPRFVYASSAAVYGNPTRLPIREDDPTLPISPYGVSKLASERYADVYSQLYGVRSSSARMFSVYGPRQRKQVIFDVMTKLIATPDQIEIFGDGTQERDFCHVDDAVSALLTIAACAPGKGEVYNVASGVSHSIKHVVETWCKILNLHPRLNSTGQVRAGEPDKWTVDISALKKLGFVPHMSLEEGLRQIKDWYDAQF